MKDNNVSRWVSAEREVKGKLYWCVYDRVNHKWSTLSRHGQYVLKKDCDRAILDTNRRAMELEKAQHRSIADQWPVAVSMVF